MQKVLIVEDERIVALSYMKLFQLHNFKVIGSLSNGEDAVEMARLRKPDIILMDINLEGKISGVTAAKEICKDYTPKIIFISAYPVDKDEIYSISPHYLQKPISEPELLHIIK